MIELTISEIHFIKIQLLARQEWIEDNFSDESIEEYEKENITSALDKLNKIKIKLSI